MHTDPPLNDAQFAHLRDHEADNEYELPGAYTSHTGDTDTALATRIIGMLLAAALIVIGLWRGYGGLWWAR